MSSIARVFAVLLAIPGFLLVGLSFYLIVVNDSPDRLASTLVVVPVIGTGMASCMVSFIVYLLANIADDVEKIKEGSDAESMRAIERNVKFLLEELRHMGSKSLKA